MQGYMHIEQRGEDGQWRLLHAGEFLFPDDETIAAAAALLDAFTDGQEDYPAEALRLCVWPNQTAPADRVPGHAAAVFTHAAVKLSEGTGGIWRSAARLLRWGALVSFSCQDQAMPTAIAFGSLPAALSGALPVETKRAYWYHPADGQDTSCEDEQHFEHVLEGAEQMWLTLRSAQDAVTWRPGEAVAIAGRLSEGTLRQQMTELHERMGSEADARLHALIEAHREAVNELDSDDKPGHKALRQRFQQEVAALYYQYQNAPR